MPGLRLSLEAIYRDRVYPCSYFRNGKRVMLYAEEHEPGFNELSGRWYKDVSAEEVVVRTITELDPPCRE